MKKIEYISSIFCAESIKKGFKVIRIKDHNHRFWKLLYKKPLCAVGHSHGTAHVCHAFLPLCQPKWIQPPDFGLTND